MDVWGIIQPFIQPIIGTIIAIIAAVVLAKFQLDNKDRFNLEKINEIAEGALDMIRMNNPGMKLIDQIDFYKDQLFDALLKDPGVTNNTSVLARATAKAITKTMTAEKAAGLEWKVQPKE